MRTRQPPIAALWICDAMGTSRGSTARISAVGASNRGFTSTNHSGPPASSCCRSNGFVDLQWHRAQLDETSGFGMHGRALKSALVHQRDTLNACVRPWRHALQSLGALQQVEGPAQSVTHETFRAWRRSKDAAHGTVPRTV